MIGAEVIPVRVIRSASMRPLHGKRVAVLGYGSQGRAQAHNMRDAGYTPTIGLPSRSRSRRAARRDGFTICTPGRATAGADVILVLAPDHVHGTLYENDIRPQLREGQMLVFAHASSIHFGLIKPPPFVDVILIAPLGPGKRLRELRGLKDGVASFFAVHQNPSRRARPVGLALARVIGCLPAGAIETTFAAEAVGDLFGEQAVLCGGLGALLTAGVETLVRHGHAPHTAYLECVYQIDLIVDLIKSEGLEGMYRRISLTASYGAAVAGPKIITPAVHRAMARMYQQVDSGRFFREWVKGAARRRGRPPRPEVPPGFRRGEREILREFGRNDKR
jgi:ketol-acid reductoisomerase